MTVPIVCGGNRDLNLCQKFFRPRSIPVVDLVDFKRVSAEEIAVFAEISQCLMQALAVLFIGAPIRVGEIIS